MAEESKSSLQKVLEEMLARTKQYKQSPQAQVNAQMSAKEPNFAAGALVGQLLASYIGKQLQNRRDKQTIEDTNPPTTLGEEPAAVETRNPFGMQPEQQMPDMQSTLGNNANLQNAANQYANLFGDGGALRQAADDEYWKRLQQVSAPFAQGW